MLIAKDWNCKAAPSFSIGEGWCGFQGGFVEVLNYKVTVLIEESEAV